MNNDRGYPYANVAVISDPRKVEAILLALSTIPIVTDNNGKKGFFLKSEGNSNGSQQVKFAIGPLEFIVDFDISTLSIILQVVFHVPFDGDVVLAQATGNITDGIKITIGYPGFLGGTITIKLDGKNIVLCWDFVYLGEEYSGCVVIGQI